MRIPVTDGIARATLASLQWQGGYPVRPRAQIRPSRRRAAPPSDSAPEGEIVALPPDDSEAEALLARARRHLMRVDRRLNPIIKQLGPCLYRRRPSGFATLFHAILRQQLSGKAAATIAARVEVACANSITPEAIASLDDAAYAAAGVSRQKRDYLRGLAAACLAAPGFFTMLETMPDEAAIAALTSVKGIGRWTAEMYLMFSLGRLDLLPVGDLSIRAALEATHGLPRNAHNIMVKEFGESWRPYRSVASWYLYAYLDQTRALIQKK
jgi:DNA-3-methyladenine glycosylase II